MSSKIESAVRRNERRQARREGKKARSHSALLETSRNTEHVDNRTHRRPNHRNIVPLTDAQRHYDAAIASSSVTFGIGPAGTGKTWLAAVRAAQALDAGVIERIIVTRPAMEAGEKLGFLPGELDEKYEPYFRPVRDALEEQLGTGPLNYYLRSGIIEARPLGLLRGSTFKNAWVILDEAQNATKTQMKMFLTRIGEGAKLIINGDPRQIDLPYGGDSGLKDAVNRLHGIPDISVVEFRSADIVRHGLCKAIVEAYESDHTVRAEVRYDSDAQGVRRMLGVE